jgi:AraC-like DNA-binding protein
MSVASLLPPPQSFQLRLAISKDYQILHADSWGALELIIRAKPISVVVLDPTIDLFAGVDTCEELIQKYSSVPFVAYVRVGAPAIQAVARLGRAGLQDVILLDEDDCAARIKGMIDSMSSSPLTTVFLSRLKPLLERLPGRIGATVESLFHLPEMYLRAQDLAASAAVTMSCLYRSFKSAELSSPKRFLTAARVLRGYKYLLDPQFSVEHAALKTGYPSARAFVRHIRDVYGMSPSRLRAPVDVDDALGKLHEWLVPDEISASAARFADPQFIARWSLMADENLYRVEQEV